MGTGKPKGRSFLVLKPKRTVPFGLPVPFGFPLTPYFTGKIEAHFTDQLHIV